MGDAVASDDVGEGQPTAVGSPASVLARSDGGDPSEGDVLGRYLIIDRIGAGAMGVVFRAYDPKLRREVALKLVRSGRGATRDEGQARLLREAQALARLSHPNVVTVFDAERTEQGVCLAMEYVQGCTLRDWSKARPRRWTDVVELMLAVARGLAAAHATGLVHRDVKPDNILVGSDGRVRVTDFGLARGIGSVQTERAIERSSDAREDELVTELGTVMGTPSYMAPEQHAGATADARTDQYALCVTLWEGLYGARPFSGRDLDALERAKHHGPPARPRGPVPSWLYAAVARGLAVRPDDRWSSVKALLEALTTGRARARRRRMWLGVGAIVLSGGAAVAWQGWNRAQRVAGCERAGTEIAEIWNDDAKLALRGALLHTGVPFAEITHDKLVPWVDRWTRAWSDMRTESCIEAEVERARPPDLYALSVACLDERRDELAGLLDVLGEPDATTVQRAVPAAAGLAPLSSCGDAATLQRRPAPPASADASRAAELRRELMRVSGLDAAGRYAQGLARAEALLERTEALGYVPLVIAARFRVGRLAERTGRLDLAEHALARAYTEAAEHGLDDLAADAASWLVHVVGVKAARHDEGLARADAAEILVRRLNEDDSLNGAALWSRLALLHWARGEYSQAQALGERTLAIRESILGPGHPDVAQTLNSLATILSARGQEAQARVLQERALAIYESALGPEHPRIALCLNNLADLLTTLGELDEAGPLFERAIAIDAAALGPEHPEVAHAVHNLARLHGARGENEEARALFERAIAIREKGLGDHPLLASSFNGLASIDFAEGDFDGAETHFARALAIYEAALGPEHIDVAHVLNNLAAVQTRRHAFEDARAMYERALAIRERVLGPDHPDLVLLLDNLGRVQLEQGDLDRAEGLHERAVTVAMAAYGAAHPWTATALGGRASVHAARGEYEEAEPMQRQVIATLEATYGPEHLLLAHPLFELGSTALARGRPDEAVSLLERSVAVYGEELASRQPPADTYFALGRATWHASPGAGRDRARAHALVREAAASWRAASPAYARELAEAESWLKTHRR